MLIIKVCELYVINIKDIIYVNIDYKDMETSIKNSKYVFTNDSLDFKDYDNIIDIKILNYISQTYKKLYYRTLKDAYDDIDNIKNNIIINKCCVTTALKYTKYYQILNSKVKFKCDEYYFKYREYCKFNKINFEDVPNNIIYSFINKDFIVRSSYKIIPEILKNYESIQFEDTNKLLEHLYNANNVYMYADNNKLYF